MSRRGGRRFAGGGERAENSGYDAGPRACAAERLPRRPRALHPAPGGIAGPAGGGSLRWSSLVLVFLAVAGCAQVDESRLKWTRVELEGGRICFEIPEGFDLAEGVTPVGETKIQYRNYSTSINGKFLGVLHNLCQKEIDESSFTHLPPQLDEGALEVSRRPVELSSIRGQECLLRVEGRDMLVLSRQYAFGKNMVTIVSSAPAAEIACPLVSRFLESLALKR